MTRRIPHRRGGAAATEMAILLPFLALAMSATLDFARVFHATQVLTGAADRGAAFAGGTAWVPLSTGSPGAVAKTEAVAEGATLNPPLRAEQVAVTYAGGTATVAVQYDFPLITAFLVPNGTVTLKRSAIVRVTPVAGE